MTAPSDEYFLVSDLFEEGRVPVTNFNDPKIPEMLSTYQGNENGDLILLVVKRHYKVDGTEGVKMLDGKEVKFVELFVNGIFQWSGERWNTKWPDVGVALDS